MILRFLLTILLTPPLLAAPEAPPPNPPALLKTDHLNVEILDFPTRTLIRSLPDHSVIATFDWLHGRAAPPAFTTHTTRGNHSFTSRVRLGSTTLTRTITAAEDSPVIFIHLLADMPGALGFQASLNPPEGKSSSVIDRRQLHWQDPQAPREARLWVLPFESDVEPAASAITLRGEGEALVILTFGTTTRADLVTTLGEKHAPGETPPNPAKIWLGISREKP